MTNYENDHLNPPNEPDKETTECEYCLGDGWVLLEQPEDEGKEIRINCPKCEGKGYLEY